MGRRECRGCCEHHDPWHYLCISLHRLEQHGPCQSLLTPRALRFLLISWAESADSLNRTQTGFTLNRILIQFISQNLPGSNSVSIIMFIASSWEAFWLQAQQAQAWLFKNSFPNIRWKVQRTSLVPSHPAPSGSLRSHCTSAQCSCAHWVSLSFTSKSFHNQCL